MSGRRSTDREQCGHLEARLTAIESWLARLEGYFGWSIGLTVTTLLSSLGTVLLLYFQK